LKKFQNIFVINLTPIYTRTWFVLQGSGDFTWRVSDLWRISGGYLEGVWLWRIKWGVTWRLSDLWRIKWGL